MLARNAGSSTGIHLASSDRLTNCSIGLFCLQQIQRVLSATFDITISLTPFGCYTNSMADDTQLVAVKGSSDEEGKALLKRISEGEAVEGLTMGMRRFLAVRDRFNDDKTCARFVGLKAANVKHWKWQNKLFEQLLIISRDAVIPALVETAKEMLRDNVIPAAQLHVDLVQAPPYIDKPSVLKEQRQAAKDILTSHGILKSQEDDTGNAIKLHVLVEQTLGRRDPTPIEGQYTVKPALPKRPLRFRPSARQ